jgi:hypothetical protein
MKILAILQNQWFKDPEKVRAIYARHPDLRNEFIRRFLFMGCPTGRHILRAFGEDLCRRIVWEEASPEIGGKPSSLFRADREHVQQAIARHGPDVVVAFGREAEQAVTAVWNGLVVICPHPTARQPGVRSRLAQGACALRHILERADKAEAHHV